MNATPSGVEAASTASEYEQKHESKCVPELPEASDSERTDRWVRETVV